MRRASLIALACLLAGCGGAKTTPPPTKTKAPFVCHHKQPGQLGECVRLELEYEGNHPTSPPHAFARVIRPQCVDISRWQPHPEFRVLRREGIVCVIVQGADNDHASNPFFDSQVRGAHEAGLKVGVYIFAEGASSTAQADVLIGVARSERSRITLGAAVDAEVPAAYARACEIANVLARSFHLIETYGSPGTYEGGRCVGYNWPAEWSLFPASPLPGYPSSAIKFRQWCGTCHLAGNSGEIDRDEDLGLIALSVPPTKHQQLVTAEHLTALSLGILHAHGCFHVHGRRAWRGCPHWGKKWRQQSAIVRRLRT